MPGYDRTGPLGGGPRTGRGMGLCGPPQSGRSVGIEDRGAWWGFGPWGRGRGRGFRGGGWGWGRGRGFGGGGWGRRWGFGAGPMAIEDLLGPGATASQQQSFLVTQMEALTAALDRVKELLSKSSPPEGEDRE